MSLINLAAREVHAKIVYYGPGLSGKTTNLLNIHQRLPAAARGRMKSIETEAERTLFFDFVPLGAAKVGGYTIQFHLYSVPGQEPYSRTRRAILGGADGVVFVADAAPDRQDANQASLAELADHLRHHQRDIADIPLVLQYNKMDLEQAVPAEELNQTLNPANRPHVAAIALRGNGVTETLREVCRLVARRL